VAMYMDFDFSGFGDFTTTDENIEIKKVKKYDRVWRVGEGGSVCQKPTAENGKIFFGALDGYVYCADAETGEELWRTKLDGIVMVSSPLIVGNMIFIGSYDYNVYAIDKTNGKIIWRFRTNGEIVSTASYFGEKIYIGSKDGHLYCVDVNGSLVWKFRTGGEVASLPTIVDGKVIFGSFDGFVYCLDAYSGTEMWKFRTGAEAWHINKLPVFEEKTLEGNTIKKILVPSFDNFLYCLDVETGNEMWRFRTGKYGNSSAPVIFDNIIYQSTRDGILYAIDFEGRELWRFRTGEPVDAGFEYGNLFVICSGDGNVYALDKKTGQEIWRYHTGSLNYHIPTFWNGKIYFSSWDCHIYAIDINGNPLWRFATSSSKPSYVPPTYEGWEAEIKKSAELSDTVESADRYAPSETINLSDYGAKSEYAGKSEYTHNSEYSAEFIIFEGAFNTSVEGMFIPQNHFVFGAG